jgi:hypothetical protein
VTGGWVGRAQGVGRGADFRGMRAAAGFSDILNEKLAAGAAAWRVPPVERPAARPGFNPLFLSVGPVPWHYGDVAPGAACFAYGGPVPVAAPPQSTRPIRRSRTLSATQRAALQCLRDLGADALDESYSDAEIKGAYRRLAQRFHPDRHPGADESERARLAHAFSRVTTAYRLLNVASLS